MSTIADFIKKLNSRTEKSTVQKDLASTLKELQGLVIPLSKDLSVQASVVPFRSDFYEVFTSHFYDNIKFDRKSKDAWLDLNHLLTNVAENCDELNKQVTEYMAEDVLRDGITAKAANMVRLAAAISFVSSYSMDMMDYALVQESVKQGGEDTIAPAQSAYVKASLEKYIRLLADVSISPVKFKALLGNIPDVYISKDNMSSVAAVFKEKDLDPFDNMRVLNNWSGSIIYSVRLMYETFMAERYHAAKDRKKLMELRLIHLNNLYAKNPNPRLEKEIDGLQKRISDYDRKIREIEQSL